MSVLIVEDEMLIALDLQLELEDKGFTVTVATSIDEALNALSSKTFTWALLDLSIGNASTLPIAEELKKAGTKICFVTGGELCRDTLERLSATLFSKPVDINRLSEHVAGA